MEHKEIYSRILDIHKHIFEQLKFAETKNNILLVFIVAFIAMTVRFLQSSNNDNIGIKVFMISMLIILLCAAFELLLSFKPILDNKEKEYNFLVRIFKYFAKTQSSPNLCNIYFFKDLAKINSKELIEIIIRDLEDNTEKEKIQNDKFINDLLNQICVLSLITLNKHKCFLNSL
ncbi:hypothetical protein CYD02_05340, partial [Campylobacter coli]|nr:hypothetical protein [Campylobacter coli]EAI8102772.1 hypothetical protein [Campylobacter coli]EAJ1074033.1 hypothetical protein [Campylobacter coli]EHZ5035476.1 hypothetical protein [Campylobacter coli]EJT2964311.1 hypothetical protein [Campylobacter coli]